MRYITWIIGFLVGFFAVVHFASATINCAGIHIMPASCGYLDGIDNIQGTVDITLDEDEVGLKITANATQTSDLVQMFGSDGTTKWFSFLKDSGNNRRQMHIYGSYTDASNYERLQIEHRPSDDATILTQAAGSGTARDLLLGVTAGAALQLTPTNGQFKIGASNIMSYDSNNFRPGTSGIDLGRDANRWDNIFMEGTIDNTLDADEVGLKITANATQTSDLMQVFDSDGTTHRFSIEGDGQVLAVDGSASTPGYSFGSDTDSGMYSNGTDLFFARSGVQRVALTGAGVSIAGGYPVLFSGNGHIGNGGGSNPTNIYYDGTLDAQLESDTQAIKITANATQTSDLMQVFDSDGTTKRVSLLKGSNGYELQMYNAFTDASNYERGILTWDDTNNIFVLKVEALGTGGHRTLQLGGNTSPAQGNIHLNQFGIGLRFGGSNQWTMDTSGNFLASSNKNIGDGGSNNPTDLYLDGNITNAGTIDNTLDADEVGLKITANGTQTSDLVQMFDSDGTTKRVAFDKDHQLVLYDTYTDANNYDGVLFDMTEAGDRLHIKATKAGTGGNVSIFLSTNGGGLALSSAGSVQMTDTNGTVATFTFDNTDIDFRNNQNIGDGADDNPTNIYYDGKLVNTPQAVSCTCSDDPTCGSDATAGTLTLEPTADTVRITNDDPNGCDVTLSETNAQDGDMVRITVVSNAGGSVDIAESAGVIETTGNLQLGIWDVLGIEYVSDRWVEAFLSNN